MLTGKKTYFAGAGAILLAIGGALTGTVPIPDAIQMVITAVLGMTLRKGISTETK